MVSSLPHQNFISEHASPLPQSSSSSDTRLLPSPPMTGISVLASVPASVPYATPSSTPISVLVTAPLMVAATGTFAPSTKSVPSETKYACSLLPLSDSDEPASPCSSVVPSPKPTGDALDDGTKAPHFSLPPLQGAWKVPLKLPLANSNGQHLPNSLGQRRVDETIPSNQSDEAQHKRFPWAAKMDSSLRNLYRTTSPTYMDDGTPKVNIPNHVLLKGLENQREFIIGQFYRCSTPSAGLVHALVNKIWGKKCKIFVRKLSEASYLFHIPDASTRSWVIHRGLWHIDDCLMFVAPWSPAATLELPEISTIPVWVTLKNIPSQLYSMQGISWIASALGAPMATNKPRLDPTLMGEAKILVEVELNKPFPQKIAAEDNKGTLSMVDVEYSWLPSKCGRCAQLGHKESRCLQKPMVSSNGKACPLPELQVSDSHTLGALDHGRPPIASDMLANTTTTEVVSLPTEETTSIVEVVPSTEVHETIAAVAEATHSIETTTPTCITFATHIIDVPAITSHSPSQLLLSPVADKSDCAVNLREDVTMVEYDNDNSELASLESFDDENLMTPSTQRILRERPLKPYHKFQEGEWISAHAFRGKRSRGRRGRKFD